MPFKRTRPYLALSQEIKSRLKQISKSRTEKAGRVDRVKMIFAYFQGVTISAIAREFSANRPRVERCIDKALHLRPLTTLNNFPRCLNRSVQLALIVRMS